MIAPDRQTDRQADRETGRKNCFALKPSIKNNNNKKTFYELNKGVKIIDYK